MTFLAAAAATKTSLLAQPGTVAFLVVFGMAVLLYFVFRSMSRHLRKVNQLARDEAEAEHAMAAASDDPAAPAAPSAGSGRNGSASAG